MAYAQTGEKVCKTCRNQQAEWKTNATGKYYCNSCYDMAGRPAAKMIAGWKAVYDENTGEKTVIWTTFE